MDGAAAVCRPRTYARARARASGRPAAALLVQPRPNTCTRSYCSTCPYLEGYGALWVMFT